MKVRNPFKWFLHLVQPGPWQLYLIEDHFSVDMTFSYQLMHTKDLDRNAKFRISSESN